MAFITKTKMRGKTVWAIVWMDATKGNGRLARRRTLCVGGDHKEALDAAQLQPEERAALANGAPKGVLREALRKCYDDLEKSRARDAARTVAQNTLPAFETAAVALVNNYLKLIEYREALSSGNDGVKMPANPGWRGKPLNTPMKSTTARETKRYITEFRDWLPKGLTTGVLTGAHIAQFLSAARAKSDRSAATINRIRAYLSAMFGCLTRAAANRYFRTDPAAWFRDEAESLPERNSEIVTYTAATLKAFFEAAEQRLDPNRKMLVTRKRNGVSQTFEQAANCSTEPAPVLQWALLLACTGVRRGEAENIKWSDVDLEHGVIRVYANKTDALRYVPLVGDPAGDVSPGFLDVLRAWRQARPKDVYVLPSEGEKPNYPKNAWLAAAREAEVDVTPQGLRRTFESMLAAIGFPASLAAFWLGHSVQVAESNYRSYRPGRLPGSTVDATLGLTPFLEREARSARGGAMLRMLPRIADGDAR